MKYFLQIIIFAIGTADFLLAWYVLDKLLSGMVANTLFVDIVVFTVALFIGWATDAILTSWLPAKYK